MMQKQPTSFLHRQFSILATLWESPWGAALFAGVIYIAISIYADVFFSPSKFAFYNYLADAFLHGQTWLRVLPPSVHDLVFFGEKYFLYWPPFPAFLLMPFVAIFGVELNDVWFTLLIAIINVGLMAQLLRSATSAEFLKLSKTQRAILVFFFALGTVHFTLAPFGQVWMTGPLTGIMCDMLAYLAAISFKGGQAWYFTGLALACAMLTRNHLVFTGIFPAIYLLTREKEWHWGRVIRNLALAAMPLFAALFIYMFYNYSRFGSPFDVGMAYHNMGELFRPDYEKYGAFNKHYIRNNLYYQYIHYPLPIGPNTKMGGSLFLLSPLFFAAVAAFWKMRSKILVFALAASVVVTNIPILLLMGTGWVQFGPRYTLDFTVPLLLLTALGIEKVKPAIPFLLAMIAFIQYLIGIRVLM